MKAVKVTYKNNPSNPRIQIIDLNGKHYSEVTSLVSLFHSIFQLEFELINSDEPTHRIVTVENGFNEIISLKIITMTTGN